MTEQVRVDRCADNPQGHGGEQNVTESGGEGETVEMAETAETDDVAGDGASPDESSSRDG